MTYQKIVVPLDGSDLAEAVLPFAQTIATHLNAEITLIEAISVQLASAGLPEGPLSPDAVQRLLDAERDAARDYLDGVSTWLQAQGATVKVETVMGPPASAIIDAVDPETIVAMTTHGRSGLARFALGSVASLVVRSVKSPVLVVRPFTKPVTELREILVPLDGSGVAESVIPVVQALAPAFGSRVHLVMVDPADTDSGRGYLQKVAEGLRSQGVAEVSEQIVDGRPGEAIVGVATQRGSALIAMATHGRGGLRRWVFGSVTDEILHTTAMPLLIVRGHAGP